VMVDGYELIQYTIKIKSKRWDLLYHCMQVVLLIAQCPLMVAASS
jgi:hypothetical protein